MSDETKPAARRCDGCAYYSAYDPESSGAGDCHNARAKSVDAEYPGATRVPGSWWCSEWWPADRPLPEPWVKPKCQHGDEGGCASCRTMAQFTANMFGFLR